MDSIETQDKVCQWHAAGRLFSPGTPVSSTRKTYRHDITEILFNAAVNTITQTLTSTQKINVGLYTMVSRIQIFYLNFFVKTKTDNLI